MGPRERQVGGERPWLNLQHLLERLDGLFRMIRGCVDLSRDEMCHAGGGCVRLDRHRGVDCRERFVALAVGEEQARAQQQRRRILRTLREEPSKTVERLGPVAFRRVDDRQARGRDRGAFGMGTELGEDLPRLVE